MKIEHIILREIRLPLVHHFETSFGRTYERRIILVEAKSNGLTGWGEVTCGEKPFYNEEWTDAAWLLLKDFVAPMVLGKELESPAEVAKLVAPIRGHNMTRAAVQQAAWHIEALERELPLWQVYGGRRRKVPCGVSIGIQDSVEELFALIEKELEAGYQRIKLKIKPGWDVDVIAKVRERFPATRLMADANSAYTLADAKHLAQLDEFDLMMIEQPLAHDEIIDHAELQKQVRTPICLDECIRSAHHAWQAITLDAARIINVKLGRVGGFAEAKRVHDVCQSSSIPVWCGGMLEAGIGRAHNVALSTLPNFRLPGDVSASGRYWTRDVIYPAVEVDSDGTIAVSDAVGLGYEVDVEFVRAITLREERLS